MRTILTIALLIITSTGFSQSKKLNAVLIEAQTLQEEGKTEEAIELYLKSIKMDSMIFSAHVNLGVCYFKIAEFQKSVDQYNIAQEVNPYNVSGIYNNRANSYSRLGEFQLAITDFQNAIKSKNGYASDTILSNIANNYWRMGLLDSAVIYFDKAIAVNPKAFEAKSNKAFVFMLQENYAGAAKAYEELLLLEPETFNILNNLGYIYFKQGNSEKALDYVNQSLVLKPDNSWAYRNLGLIYKEKGDKKTACKNLKKALDYEFIKYWGEADIKELIDYCEQ